MLNARRVSAEDLRADCRHRARVFERAARRQRGADDAVGAVLFTAAADIAMAQAVLLERLVIERREPQRRYFAAGQQLGESLSALGEGRAGDDAGALLVRFRERLFAAFDAETATQIAGQLSDASLLSGLAMPEPEAWAALADRRCQGLAPDEFVARRRHEAAEGMVTAHGHHLRGDDATAIQVAYESDFRSLEAYCVESAVAAGDDQLLTVELRWELVVQAMGELTGLPGEFAAAVPVIRAAMARALGEPDATRLIESMPAP